jgi:O-antigen ligase
MLQIDGNVTKRIFGGYGWGILLFVLFATISVFAAPDKMAALGIWKAYFIEPILFFIVFINTIKDNKTFNLIINAIGASALLVALPAIFQKFTGFGFTTVSFFNEATRRVTSWYGFPNAVGLYLAPIVVLFVGLYWLQITLRCDSGQATHYKRYKLVEKIYFGSVIVTSLLAIYYAKSEGALIGLAIGIVFLCLTLPNKKTRSIIAIILIIIVTSISLNVTTANYIKSKLTLSDLSGQIRIQQWKETWTMLKDNKMLFGAGLAGYKTAVAPYHQEGIWLKDKNDAEWLKKIQTDEKFRKAHWQPTEIYLYPHNFVLNFWSETGIFGLLTILGLLGIFLSGYWRVKSVDGKRMYLILLGVMLTMLVHGSVDVVYFKNDLSVWWWLVFGLGVTISDCHSGAPSGICK